MRSTTKLSRSQPRYILLLYYCIDGRVTNFAQTFVIEKMTTHIEAKKHHLPQVAWSSSSNTARTIFKLILINYIVCIDYEAQVIVVIYNLKPSTVRCSSVKWKRTTSRTAKRITSKCEWIYYVCNRNLRVHHKQFNRKQIRCLSILIRSRSPPCNRIDYYTLFLLYYNDKRWTFRSIFFLSFL